ncbi:hypothetical protein [Methylibium sp.]|nr:hypothetical protein [Methylibium sp.]
MPLWPTRTRGAGRCIEQNLAFVMAHRDVARFRFLWPKETIEALG